VAAIGAGIGGAYATLLAAGPYYELIPDWCALLPAGSVAAVAGALSLRWSSELIACIGVVGALAVPVPIAWGDRVTTTGTGFVAVMFAASAVVAVYKRWETLLSASAIVVVPQVIALAAEHAGEAAAGPLFAAVACSAILLAAGIGFHLRAGPELEPYQATLMMAAAVLTGLADVLLFQAQSREGYALLVVGAVYGAIAFPSYQRGRRDLGLFLFAVGLAAMAVGCADLLSRGFTRSGLGGGGGRARPAGTADPRPARPARFAGVPRAFARTRAPGRHAAQPSLRRERPPGGGRSLAARGVGRMRRLRSVLWRRLGRAASRRRLRGRRPAANLHAVILDAPPTQFFESNAHPASGAGAVAASAVLAFALARVANVPERLGGSAVPLYATAGVLALYAASLLVLGLFQLGGNRIETDFERGHAAVSAMSGLLALLLLYLGLTRRPSLRIAGFALFGITLAKIFLFDLATLSSVARALSFLAVGAVLLLGGFFYQRLSTDALRRREAAGR
jgi:uncharacterized membrane protein